MHAFVRSIVLTLQQSTSVVPKLPYLPLDPRFADSNPAGVDGFFSERKNPEYDFFGREVKPWVP